MTNDSEEESGLPEQNSAYATHEYWEKRYTRDAQTGKTYDWFKGYQVLRPVLHPLLEPTDRILMLGCGNATFSEDLYHDGFHHIINIDYSATVIQAMSDRCRHLSEMSWHVMNILDMSELNDNIDVAMDKGTLDALLCEPGGDVWQPSESILERVQTYMRQVDRVLKSGGLFIYISFGQPQFRRRYMLEVGWQVKVQTIGDAFHYFVYICRKP